MPRASGPHDSRSGWQRSGLPLPAWPAHAGELHGPSLGANSGGQLWGPTPGAGTKADDFQASCAPRNQAVAPRRFGTDGALQPLSKIHQNTAALDQGRVAAQIFAGGWGFDLAGRKVEDRGVLGAFHPVRHHQTIGKVNLFAGTSAVGAAIAAFLAAADGMRSTSMVEAADLLAGSASIQGMIGVRSPGVCSRRGRRA